MNGEQTDIPKEVWISKAKYYMNKAIMVHINLKNKTFYNGYIKELLDDSFIINDRESGDMPIFVLELLSIEPYLDPEEQANNRANWKRGRYQP